MTPTIINLTPKKYAGAVVLEFISSIILSKEILLYENWTQQMIYACCEFKKMKRMIIVLTSHTF